jgi:hypothetical protein
VLLPPGTTELRLRSRAAVPAELTAGLADGRRLGVAVADLCLDRVPAPDDRYGTGWHRMEGGFRWTDGCAQVLAHGVREITFKVALTETYWRDATPPAAGRRAA